MTKSTKNIPEGLRWQHWKIKHPHFIRDLRMTLFIVSGVFVFMLVNALYYRYTQRNKPIHYGVSYSTKYAEELGIDWRDGYIGLLDDMGIEKFRLMSYWDTIEPERNRYTFEDLDWQMDEAAKRGAQVMLSIGLRQPRWPECHTPNWAKTLEKSEWEQELFAYLAAVVQRYSDHPALVSYQLENEFFNRSFGDCPDHSRERLIKEFDIVRSVDPKTPINISFADQMGFPIRGPHPEVYSTSLYRANFVKHLGYFAYPIPSTYYSAKALFVRLLHGRDVIIHELQLEPWGPVRTANLTDEEQYHYMSPGQIRRNLHFARLTGMREIYMWGGEWWYWRKTHDNDLTMWGTIKSEIQDEKGPPWWQLF